MPIALPATYFRMVQSFPLTRIRDDAHLAEAQALLDDLLSQDMDEGAEAYLDALADLIESYEGQNERFPDAPARDVLKLLIESSGMSQREFSRVVGIAQSTISAFLNGTRRPTTDHSKTLADHFGVAPSVFLAE
ncbi:helix-turn-helix domain-containing protein [Tundrisphaera sp. TA3]|uniref:helix-turn-helix domain-containing protein n=1 Tax=Tundrisphaera sp. TA3 TaxID=3435775 RepID=UPI003EBB4B52